MGVVIMELNNSWKLVVLTKLQLSCIVYTMNCNFEIDEICSLTLMAYKYNELQVSSSTQKLICKASCKTPPFFYSEK